MKKSALFLLLLLCLSAVGCTSTTLKSAGWQLSRVSVFQKMDIGAAELKPDGSASLSGYKAEGGGDAVSAAVTAAINALK